MEEGIRKRVGGGKFIDIWRDKQTPELENMRIKTKEENNNRIIKISELIKEGKWDEESLLRNFEAEDIVKIRKFPISMHPTKDRLYQTVSTTREYLAKIGYKLTKSFQKNRKIKDNLGAQVTEI